MKMYYVYITINLLNNRGYVGMTNGNKKYYSGSDEDLLADIKKYGRKNFTTNRLGEFDNSKECHYWEGFYIKTLGTHISQGGYNKTWSGGRYYEVPIEKNGMLGKKHKPESIEKMKNAIVSEETKELMKANAYDRSGNKNPNFGGKYGMRGKTHSEETKKKMRKPHGPISPEKRINSGRKKGCTAWNKGLTKNTDERVKKYSHPKHMTNE